MDSAVVAAPGLSVGIVLDHAYLGIDVLPIDVVLKRTVVIVALGLTDPVEPRAERPVKTSETTCCSSERWWGYCSFSRRCSATSEPCRTLPYSSQT